MEDAKLMNKYSLSLEQKAQLRLVIDIYNYIEI